MIELHFARRDLDPKPVIALNPRYIISARHGSSFTVVTVDMLDGKSHQYGVTESPEDIAAMSRASALV